MKRLTPLVVMLCITGCVTPPEVQMIPDVVRAADMPLLAAEDRGGIGPWWQRLDDDALHSLIVTGLADSPSPRIARARLAQAEAGLTVARSALLPTLQARGQREVVDSSSPDADTRSDLGALDLFWDAGLWGKRRLEIEDARKFREQRWFERQTAELALSVSIAETYYQIVELRTQGSLLAAQIQVSEDLERLIEARFRLGQAPVNELYQQREQSAVLMQLKLVNDTRQEVLEKSLDALLGHPPDSVSRVTSTQLPETPQLIGPGAPADLIRHRADIRAAYARLQQAAVRVGIRFSERLPTLKVTANLASLTDKVLSTEWVGYVLDLAVPIFTGGRLSGLEEGAQHILEEERQRYLALWLTALEEVATLQHQHQQQQEVIATLVARRGHAQQALDAARNRYVLGDQNYLDVLTALRGLQEADRFVVSERRKLITLWIRGAESVGQPICGDVSSCEQNWQL